MLNDIDDGGFICDCSKLKSKDIVCTQGIGDGCVKGARITFLSVRTDSTQTKSKRITILKSFTVPDVFVKPSESAVKMVVRISVSTELIACAVNREASVRDAVGNASGDGAEKGMTFQIIVEGVESKNNIGVAVAAGGTQRLNNGTVIENVDRDAAWVFQGEAGYILVPEFTKWSFYNFHQ